MATAHTSEQMQRAAGGGQGRQRAVIRDLTVQSDAQTERISDSRVAADTFPTKMLHAGKAKVAVMLSGIWPLSPTGNPSARGTGRRRRAGEPAL